MLKMVRLTAIDEELGKSEEASVWLVLEGRSDGEWVSGVAGTWEVRSSRVVLHGGSAV